MAGSSELSRSDQELVVAFQRGDSLAYDEIYRRHAPRVRRVCSRMLRNPADADEATQEVFLRSYQALGRFNGQYQLGAWLSRIATNVCVDQLRARGRSIVADERPEDVIDLESPVDPPENLVTDQISLSTTLSEITPLHSKALLLRAFAGMSHHEMAGELSMSPQQVKSLLHRARSSFRRAWQHASVVVLFPGAALRRLASKSRNPHLQELIGAGPAAVSAAEKVAAGAVAAMIAVGSLMFPGAPSGAPLTSDRKFTGPRASLRSQDKKLAKVKTLAASESTGAPAAHAQKQDAVASLTSGLNGAISKSVPEDPQPNENANDGVPTPPVPTGSNDPTQAKQEADEALRALKEKLGPR